jgi:hypothetical protein
MAKKQTRRSISISRGTYERLKAFCETQGISMSQVVEGQIGGLLGSEVTVSVPRPVQPPVAPRAVAAPRPAPVPLRSEPAPVQSRPQTPMTSQAARFAVEPPPPIIKTREPVDAKPPTPQTADQIFTF